MIGACRGDYMGVLPWHSDHMGHSRSVRLPDELAPSLRAAALVLLSQVSLAHPPPLAPRKHGSTPCYFCGKPGRMGLHHVVPGDHSTVVNVHPSCHRRYHARMSRFAERTA